MVPLSDDDFDRKLNEMIGFFYTLQEARDFEQIVPEVERYTKILKENTEWLTLHRFNKKFNLIIHLGLRKGIELLNKIHSQERGGGSGNH